MILVSSRTSLAAQELAGDMIESVNSLSDAGESTNQADLELLANLTSDPLDLNHDDLRVLVDLNLVSNEQIEALALYISVHGALLAIEELQAVPGFTVKTIKDIRPLVLIRTPQSIARILGKNEPNSASHRLEFRVAYRLERTRGFTSATSINSAYLGLRPAIRLRYGFQSRHIEVGLTAEQDSGEPFRFNKRHYGFDHYNAFVRFRAINSWLREVIIGRFTVNIGQGLIGATAFGFGKGVSVGGVERTGHSIRTIKSYDEIRGSNGIAVHFQPTKSISIIAAGSLRRKDANISSYNSHSNPITDLHFTALQGSGHHRTTSEIEDRKSIKHSKILLLARYTIPGLSFGLNTVFHHFNIPWHKQSQVHNHFAFSGRELTNISLDFKGRISSLRFFGELALASNRTFATVAGVALTPHPNVDLAVTARNLPRSFWSIESSPLSESSSGNNERGVYIGLALRPSGTFKITLFADRWKHPGATSQSIIQSTGNEQHIRCTYTRRKRHRLYLQLRRKTRVRSGTVSTGDAARNVQIRESLRLHLTRSVSRSVELRNRIEIVRMTEHNQVSTGYLAYQEWIVKPMGSGFKLAGRLALFSSESYAGRVYAYEYDATGGFSIPAHFNNGIRFYLNTTMSIKPGVNIDVRAGTQWYYDRESLGSGHDYHDGNTRTEIRFRIRYRS